MIFKLQLMEKQIVSDIYWRIFKWDVASASSILNILCDIFYSEKAILISKVIA